MTFKNSVLVLGSSGLLGSELVSGQYLKEYKIISQSKKSLTDYNVDLQDFDQVYKMLDKVRPDIIINLVGLTDVDHCEKFPIKAYNLNVKTVENLVNVIQKYSLNSFLVQVSTDQVYDVEGFSIEKNINLSNYYSFSKYCGELIAAQTNSVILRTNFFGKTKISSRNSLTDWLYRELAEGNDIKVFEDVWFNPLSIYNLCKMIELVVEKKINGVFNLGSNHAMNKAEFAFHFAKELKLSTSKIKKISVSSAKFLHAYRPKNMSMNVTKFEKNYNIKLPKLIEEIELTAKEYIK